jgi:hypothetical protein
MSSSLKSIPTALATVRTHRLLHRDTRVVRAWVDVGPYSTSPPALPHLPPPSLAPTHRPHTAHLLARGTVNWHEFKEMLHSTLMIFLSVPTHTGLTPNPYAHTPCAILPLHPQAHRRCTRSSQCMLCYLLTDGMCTSCYAMQVPKMRTLFEEIDHDRDGAVSCKEMCRKLFPNQDWELIWHERAEQLLFDERTRAAIYVQSRRSHSARIPTCIVRALFALWRVHCVCCAGATGLPWTPCPSLDQPTLAARGGGGEYDRRLERELLRVGGPARPH